MRLSLYPFAAAFFLMPLVAACDDADSHQIGAVQEAPVSTTEALPEPVTPDTGAGNLTIDEEIVEETDNAVAGDETPHSDLPPPSRDVFVDAECDFEAWVGQPVADVETALQETGRPSRVLMPDSMMTMDHNPDRINVVHEDGTVTRVWCG